MKYLRIIQSFLSFIPFIWFVFFLSILIAGAFKLGYIPEYGDNIDPSALDIDLLSTAHIIFFFASSLSILLLIIITPILKIKTGKIFTSKTSFILLTMGLIGFLLFKYLLTAHYLWVFD